MPACQHGRSEEEALALQRIITLIDRQPCFETRVRDGQNEVQATP